MKIDIFGLTIADFNLSQNSYDNNNGGTLNGVNQPSLSTDLNSNRLSLGLFTKKYQSNNFFQFIYLNKLLIPTRKVDRKSSAIRNIIFL